MTTTQRPRPELLPYDVWTEGMKKKKETAEMAVLVFPSYPVTMTCDVQME